jgi:hypothetical protein
LLFPYTIVEVTPPRCNINSVDASHAIDDFTTSLSEEETAWDYHTDIDDFESRVDLFHATEASTTPSAGSGLDIIAFLCQFDGNPSEAHSKVTEAIIRTRKSIVGVEQAAERHAAGTEMRQDFLTSDASDL